MAAGRSGFDCAFREHALRVSITIDASLHTRS
jgi:hypothetical protein